jgi:hypothetical protein
LQAALARFRRWTAPPRRGFKAASRPAKALLDQQLLPAFKNERKLREYQVILATDDQLCDGRAPAGDGLAGRTAVQVIMLWVLAVPLAVH